LPGQAGPDVIGINLPGVAAIPVLSSLVTGYMVQNAAFDRLVQRDLGSRALPGGDAGRPAQTAEEVEALGRRTVVAQADVRDYAG
jgi:hypothetical protein